MKYPESDKEIEIGDIVWFYEGTVLARVTEVMESSDVTVSIMEPGVFITHNIYDLTRKGETYFPSKYLRDQGVDVISKAQKCFFQKLFEQLLDENGGLNGENLNCIEVELSTTDIDESLVEYVDKVYFEFTNSNLIYVFNRLSSTWNKEKKSKLV